MNKERAEQAVIAAARALLARQPLMRGGYHLNGAELTAYQTLLARVRDLETALAPTTNMEGIES